MEGTPGFSGALKLVGVDDLRGQSCINPIVLEKIEKKKENDTKRARISLEDDGTYVEVSADGRKEILETAKVDLKDCLACSGCITTAESVLITQQSKEEYFEKLKLKQPDDVFVISVSPQSRASIAAYYKIGIVQAARKLITLFKLLGADYVFDTSFSREFSLLESMIEFVARYKKEREGRFPLIASACPGWICYAEKTHSEVLPHISTVKSPQQVMGTVVKYYFGEKINKRANKIYHVAVMPCFDKKLEASREDFYNKELETRDVDCVLTSGEILAMIQERGIDFLALDEAPMDKLFTNVDDENNVFGPPGGSGGYLECIFKFAAKELFNKDVATLEYKPSRLPGWKEVTLEVDGAVVLHFALAYGFPSIQNLIRKMNNKKIPCPYHYIEVMACPSGCVNGGGQIKAEAGEAPKDLIKRVDALYHEQKESRPQDNQIVQQLYKEWIGDQYGGQRAIELLHTQYHAIPKMKTAQAIQW